MTSVKVQSAFDPVQSALDPAPGTGSRPFQVATSPAAALDARRSGTATTPGAARDALSLGAGGDVAGVLLRLCLWCRRSPLEQTQLRWCSKRCRQAAWRSRQLLVAEDPDDTPKRLAYADPPYPGSAFRYYRNEPTYAGEVDHGELLSRLEHFDGWALSTSAKALRDVLAVCPADAKVAAWVKPNGVSSKTRGPHNTWEPVIYRPARLRQPGFRDWLCAKPARGGGTLPGRKPLAFCAFLFQLLGASPGDELDDLFPGTGIVTAAFLEWRRSAPSLTPRGDGA